MHEWTKWSGRISMDELAHALGLESSKKNIDGSQVFEYYQKGKLKEICDYCKEDVRVTRQIYHRLNFEDAGDEGQDVSTLF
jgi:predicted PolB exonuclease-like 3'-5' exonuclease